MHIPSALRCAAIAVSAAGPLTVAARPPLDVLQDPSVNWSDPRSRNEAVLQLQQAEQQEQRDVETKAAALGLPLRSTQPNGRVRQIHTFSDGSPRYKTTFNVTAAISTGAAALQSAPFNLLGSNVTVGVWDAGSARSSHQEFTNRVTIRDGAAADDHATHVAGTIAASGVQPAARGMAPAAAVSSYDWDADQSEMTAAAAVSSSDATKLFLSNHSYGLVTGWDRVDGGLPYRMWEWNGDAAAKADPAYGRYQSEAAAVDAITNNAPYFLPFWAAGNDRTDNPASGDTIALSPNASTVASFNAAIHPPGDGAYRNGFDTIAGWGVAKNALTIGSVADAATSGNRDVSKAAVDDFSCWGPTDDGRIKPDLVANGNEVYSTTATSNQSYDSYSGTSMASPNACGSAALLVQHYRSLFPGQAMRAASLKALLIHTASDLGNPGPDYRSGWGLMNVRAAAELLTSHAAAPLKKHFTEASLSAATLTRTHEFEWDGVSPIRATLCWTDPAAPTTGNLDSRTPRLVRDLNLKIVAPDGTTEFFPFVMPFTSTWNTSDLNATATTGVNHIDTVEQVLVQTPPQPGIYRAVISIAAPPPSAQSYSLILSGSANSALPAIVQSVNPPQHLVGQSASITLTGTGFNPATRVLLQRAGFPTQTATSVATVSESSLTATFDLATTAAGSWDVVVQNGVSEPSTLAGALTLLAPLLTESFDATNPATGWSSDLLEGNSSMVWSLASNQSQSPSFSFFAPGTFARSTAALVSPSIAIPATTQKLRLSFWHKPNFADASDGAVLEYELTDPNAPELYQGWQDALAPDQANGTTVVSGDYNAFIGTSNTFYLGGKSAWSGVSSGFILTTIEFSDVARFAGKSMRLRWVIGTSRTTNSVGWHVDSISLGALDASHMVAPNSLTAWRSNHFSATEISDGLAASTADPDGDGLVNLAEYALGLDPRSNGAMPHTFNHLPTPSLTLSRPGDLPNVLWLPQVSSNLIDWSPAALQVLSAGPPESVLITAPESFPTSGKIFFRVQFEER